MLVGEINPDTLFATAAIITALAGGITTIYQMIVGKKEKQKAVDDATFAAEQDCHERLRKVQHEANEISDELHQLKMKQREQDES